MSAHYNRAAALQALGQSREAIQGFERVCAIEPGHYDAHRALGFLWLAEGDRGRALDHFARTYELRRGEDRTGVAARSLTEATRSKLLHDAEQFRFLSERRRDRQRFEALARNYEEAAKDAPETATPLSDRQIDRSARTTTPRSISAARRSLRVRAVSERPDRDALMRRFKEQQAGAVWFDDLLTPPALARTETLSAGKHDLARLQPYRRVRRVLSRGWPRLSAAAADRGRDSPHLSGAAGKTSAVPGLGLQGSRSQGCDRRPCRRCRHQHQFLGDAGPGQLNPDRGGLVVCRVPPPAAWEIRDYHADKESIAAFLEQHANDSLIVPYRENRAVLFESRLFHRSDAPEFATGYENHRINLTLLFGRHAN